MDNISGRTVAITGAARGIGYATAQALLARGARVVIGDRDVAALESAVTSLGGRVSGHPLDVTDRESFSGFLAHVRADGGRVDVLINNAGVMPIGGFLEQGQRALRSAIEVNFYGVVTGCQLVLPEMIEGGRGHIVNVASLAGLMPVPGQTVYAATKSAVISLSSAMSDEFAARGVQVSVVMPPFTRTELISGTAQTRTNRPVEPEAIAAAIVKTLDRPKTHVTVPGGIRFVLGPLGLLGPRGRRWVGRRFGTDKVFLEFDTAARQGYEDRAQAALGVVDDADRDTRDIQR
ncbi:SDR family oxidoreductase [Mycolicibacterium fluoranthenivorans]|uniref:Short-subunit dehydrogenase n=1 Tax=Mycolicibacterium fluoranthenivorans TaxID=258505 RepID=A0A7X5TYP6_9MYCO|nr:SDR family oxidoreductase [Mycolicibacterium fluoranthenivorans]MCV7357438.1 SDR family oxidoreductase [Mycolicibacterium fluoranthenivorans]NIH95179.1 short-subunit dehydrogenase [Mycolicibacterium fluoranthenivorans]